MERARKMSDATSEREEWHALNGIVGQWLNSEDTPRWDLIDAILAAGFTRQSRAEIQAGAVEGFIATVHAAYRERFREFEEASLDAEASEVQRGRAFGRMDALAGLLNTLRERIREGGE